MCVSIKKILPKIFNDKILNWFWFSLLVPAIPLILFAIITDAVNNSYWIVYANKSELLMPFTMTSFKTISDVHEHNKINNFSEKLCKSIVIFFLALLVGSCVFYGATTLVDGFGKSSTENKDSILYIYKWQIGMSVMTVLLSAIFQFVSGFIHTTIKMSEKNESKDIRKNP